MLPRESGRGLLLRGEAGAGGQEQVGQHRGVALPRAREQPEGVRHRQRAEDRLRVVGALAHADRAQQRLGLRRRCQPVGVALDEQRPAQQREAEQLERPHLGGDRRVVQADEAEVVAALDQTWEHRRRHDGDADPGSDDRVAQPDDQAGVELGRTGGGQGVTATRAGAVAVRACSARGRPGRGAARPRSRATAAR